tara:strand:+ start:204 stop:305 length:102 start_codon:yes stop_codon:yes gene_type:complete
VKYAGVHFYTPMKLKRAFIKDALKSGRERIIEV